MKRGGYSRLYTSLEVPVLDIVLMGNPIRFRDGIEERTNRDGGRILFLLRLGFPGEELFEFLYHNLLTSF